MAVDKLSQDTWLFNQHLSQGALGFGPGSDLLAQMTNRFFAQNTSTNWVLNSGPVANYNFTGKTQQPVEVTLLVGTSNYSDVLN